MNEPTDFLSTDPQLKKTGCPESDWTYHTADDLESLYIGGQITKILDCVAMTDPVTYLTLNASTVEPAASEPKNPAHRNAPGFDICCN